MSNEKVLKRRKDAEVRTTEEIINRLVSLACWCDAMTGWTCDVHEDANELKKRLGIGQREDPISETDRVFLSFL